MDLKPCPFCGGPAEWSPGNFKGQPTCQHCGASAPIAEKWNRRAPCPECARLREELEAARAWRERWEPVVEAAGRLKALANEFADLTRQAPDYQCDLRAYVEAERQLFIAHDAAQAQPEPEAPSSACHACCRESVALVELPDGVRILGCGMQSWSGTALFIPERCMCGVEIVQEARP